MTGTATSVRMVEKVRPPMTATPIGCQSSDSSPRPIAMGNIRRIVVSAVISTGRRRLFPAAITAWLMP